MSRRDHLREAVPVDSVARWHELRGEYPEARYVFDPPWFYGALRDADDVKRATDLGRLIDQLMSREQTPRPWG